MGATISLSFIICTHRRFNLLKLTVNSFCRQSAKKELFEIIVVDNDFKPNKEVIKIVEDANAEITVRYLSEPVLGLSKARNSGEKATSGQYIGYIDDDAIASEEYVENALAIISKVNPDILGGPYFPFYLEKRPKWFLDNYETITLGTERYLGCNEFLNGTNIIINRDLLFDIGGFDESKGMAGNKIAYGEETSFQMLAWQKNPGLKVFYSPELLVYHYVPISKMNLTDKLKRSFKMGYSQTYLWINPLDVREEKKKALLILTKNIVLFSLKEPVKLIFRSKKKFAHWQNYIYEKWPRYFRSFGQEWRLIKDLIKRK